MVSTPLKIANVPNHQPENHFKSIICWKKALVINFKPYFSQTTAIRKGLLTTCLMATSSKKILWGNLASQQAQLCCRIHSEEELKENCWTIIWLGLLQYIMCIKYLQCSWRLIYTGIGPLNAVNHNLIFLGDTPFVPSTEIFFNSLLSNRVSVSSFWNHFGKTIKLKVFTNSTIHKFEHIQTPSLLVARPCGCSLPFCFKSSLGSLLYHHWFCS